MSTNQYRTGVGQDSHRFLPNDTTKVCMIGGAFFENTPGFKANSDGDVIFHAICRALSSLSGVQILGVKADEMLHKDGITDSSFYLKEAVLSLGNQEIVHIAITVEALRPFFQNRCEEIRNNIAHCCSIEIAQVGITFSTGEGLTDCGCGDGVSAFCIVTTKQKI